MSCFSRPFTANEMDWRGVEEGETMLRFSNKPSLHGTRDITTCGSEASTFGESRRCTNNMVWRFKVEFSRCPVKLNEASPPRSYHQDQPSWNPYQRPLFPRRGVRRYQQKAWQIQIHRQADGPWVLAILVIESLLTPTKRRNKVTHCIHFPWSTPQEKSCNEPFLLKNCHKETGADRVGPSSYTTRPVWICSKIRRSSWTRNSVSGFDFWYHHAILLWKVHGLSRSARLQRSFLSYRHECLWVRSTFAPHIMARPIDELASYWNRAQADAWPGIGTSIAKSKCGSLHTFLILAKNFIQQWKRQIEDIMKSDDLKTRNDTIFHGLLNSNLPPSEKSIDRMLQEAQLLVVAGQDTTGDSSLVRSWNLPGFLLIIQVSPWHA